MDYSNGGVKRSGGSSRRDDFGGNSAKRSRIDNASDSFEPIIRPADETNAQMLTFKRFLAQQEDDISDEDAIKKYNDYKFDFKKKQLVKFFEAHKAEEWFRNKYHPVDSEKWKQEKLEAAQKRFEIFEEFRKAGTFDVTSVDLKNAKELIRMMDTVVVKLEGGTDADVKALESERIEDDSLIEIKREQEKEKEREKETKKDEESTEKEDKTESESQDANGADKPNGTGAAEKTNQEDGALSDGDDSTKKKMLLHKTSSIFLRNVPPSVTQEELEGLCKRSPGFLRLCFSEPFHDRKWHRRAWATYRRDVNIREICWTINNIKIRDSELNGIINRDITRRVRTANGVTGHVSVAQNDLKQAAKLVALLDKQIGMFTNESEEERIKDIQLGVDLVEASKNPILRSVRDVYLDAMLDDVSPEEEEMLGIQKSSSYAGSGGEVSEADEKIPFNRDERVIKALDKLIFYLRIVHSVDYYFHGEYPNEDKMPNRCGMFHVRAPTPTAALPPFTATDDGKLMMPKKFVTDFITSFSQRLSAEFFSIEFISQDDLEKLGKNDPEEALEKFILENTVELAKDKWLCPLSGKKFKGPEFIRKHLETKHQERLDEAKVDALFYNNYLIDARRPMEPEGRQLQTATPQRDRERGEDDRRDRERERGGDRFDDRRRDGGSLFGSGGGGDRNRSFPNRSGGYDRGGDHGRPNQGGGRYFDDGARGRRDPRVPIAYRDLDAPEDIA